MFIALEDVEELENKESLFRCEPEENSFVKSIEKLINKKIEVISNHDYAQTDKPMNAQERKHLKRKTKKKTRIFR